VSAESHLRSVVKALTWRFIATFITAGVAWAFIGELREAAAIGVADTLLKLGIYYSHERLWNRIPLGRAKEPEYQI